MVLVYISKIKVISIEYLKTILSLARNVSTPGSSPIPSNVIDQIWLWDRELHRVQFTKVYQHQCIMGINEYNAIIQYVTDKNIYNYNNERKLLLLLDYNHIERIQAYIRQWRSQTITRERHQQE